MANRSATLLALAVATILFVAVGLRVYKCFDWPLDGDEIYTLDNSRVMHWGIDPDELSERIYALCPLSFYLNRPLLDAGARDEVAIRAVPLLAGIVGCFWLSWLVLRSFGPRVAAVVAVLLALNPYHVEMSQYGRYYALVFLLANVSWLLLHESIRDRSLRKLALSLFALAAAVLSHLPAAFLLPAELLYVLIVWTRSRDKSVQRRYFWWAAGLLLAGGIGLVIYVYPAIGQWSGVEQSGGRGPLGLVAGWAAAVGLGIAVLTVIGIAYLVAKRDQRVWLPLVALAVPCALLLGLAVLDTTVMPQFVGYVYFPMFVNCGLLIDALVCCNDNPEKTARAKTIAGVLLSLAVVPALPSLASQYVDGNRHDFRACVEVMRINVRRGGVVYSSWPHVFAYHARRMLDVPVVLETNAAVDLEAEIRAGKLVVLNVPERLYAKPSLPYLHEDSLWVVKKIDRDRDDSKMDFTKRIVVEWDLISKYRFEFAPPRFDHRRNRLDIYRLDEERFGNKIVG